MHQTRFSLHCVLTAQQMRDADAATIVSGVPSYALMERAGAQAAQVIRTLYAPRPTLVLCGSGNNGGDGYVVARLLHDAGWPVRVAVVLAPQTDDAHRAAQECPVQAGIWQGEVPEHVELVIDAVFGTGLSRPVEGTLAKWMNALNDSGVAIVALDMPSGICADTGVVMGAAVRAAHTISFCRAKRGHLLWPGRGYAGQLHVADIGIADDIVDAQTPRCFLNHPALWRPSLPQPDATAHKYQRGHVAVLGGGMLTGAAKLASLAALRSGSGLASLLCPPDVWPIYAASLMSVMAKPCMPEQIAEYLADERIGVWLLGPGAADGWPLRQVVSQVLMAQRKTVLDADALTAFAGHAATLAQAIASEVVVTPHEGEFAKLFVGQSWLQSTDKCERATQAAKLLGAVVVLKGPDTVIASPDGRLIINDAALPQLATAGSGDVLSGIIAGLMAQGMTAFDAAAAAVWMHAQAARLLGRGMIAEDLISTLPQVMQQL